MFDEVSGQFSVWDCQFCLICHDVSQCKLVMSRIDFFERPMSDRNVQTRMSGLRFVTTYSSAIHYNNNQRTLGESYQF
jgi:Zn-finger protein